MFINQCALIIKYYMGEVVARAPSVPANVARETLKRCLIWVECLGCVQTSAPLQEKSGEESLLPTFSEEGRRLYTGF